jgi:hypothetical protein
MATGADGRWEMGIGDPSPMGWVTVAAYAVAAMLAARNALAARRTAVPAGFWLALCGLMLLLGVNKQLDVQTWFGQTGRDIAIAQGWYERRRLVQGVFIVVLCGAAVVALAIARRLWRSLWQEYRWAFGGVAMLLTFIIIRAATFHHVDAVLGVSVGVSTAGRLLEVLGVLIVAVACAHWHAMHRRRVRRFAVAHSLRGRA